MEDAIKRTRQQDGGAAGLLLLCPTQQPQSREGPFQRNGQYAKLSTVFWGYTSFIWCIYKQAHAGSGQ